jgi:hypothetical protein
MQVRIMNLFFAIVIIIGFYSTSFAQLTSSGVENMSKNADLILTGNVVEQNSSWNENNTRIYTQATIRVEEYLKGSNNSGLVIVSYLGGEVGDVGEMYSHMPRFENNEEVLVFLKKDDKNTNYKVFNGEEGKINVIIDPKTGEKVTTSNVQINTLKAQIKSYIKD